jgi:hypothetical protein
MSCALVIRANELCIGQHVAPHSLLDLRFRRASQIERDIQRVEFMEVAVGANRRTRAAIPRLFEIIEPKVPCGNPALPAFSGKFLVSGGML